MPVLPLMRLSVALLVAACAAPAPMPTELDPTEVTQARVVKTPPAVVEFTGVITSRRSSVISAQVQARIEELDIHSGQVVKPGELVALFDPTDLIIRFAVPKEHRGAVRKGQRVELTIEGSQRTVWATVTSISGAQEPPLNFTVVEADIGGPKLPPEELAVSSIGRVRIADARG